MGASRQMSRHTGEHACMQAPCHVHKSWYSHTRTRSGTQTCTHIMQACTHFRRLRRRHARMHTDTQNCTHWHVGRHAFRHMLMDRHAQPRCKGDIRAQPHLPLLHRTRRLFRPQNTSDDLTSFVDVVDVHVCFWRQSLVSIFDQIASSD